MARPLANFLLCLPLVLLAILWLPGCAENDDDPNPKVSILAKKLGSQISSLRELVLEPLANNDSRAAEEVLANFFMKAAAAGKPIENGILILNAKGVTFAERHPAPGHPDGVSGSSSAKDYSSYHMVRKALENSRTELGVVYLDQDKLYVVCCPLGKRKPVGVLVLGILGSYLEARIGVSGQEFLKMDIKPES